MRSIDDMEAEAKATDDARAVTLATKTGGWAAIKARIESKRAEYAERLDALPLDADDKEVFLLRVRTKLLREILEIPEAIIAEGALALEGRQEREEAERLAEEEAQDKRRIDAAFQEELDRLRKPILAG